MRCSRIHQRTRAAISQWGAETPSHLSDETLIFNKGGKRCGCSEGKTGQYGGSNLKKPFKQEGLLYVQTKLELLEEASTACVYSRFKGEWELARSARQALCLKWQVRHVSNAVSNQSLYWLAFHYVKPTVQFHVNRFTAASTTVGKWGGC